MSVVMWEVTYCCACVGSRRRRFDDDGAASKAPTGCFGRLDPESSDSEEGSSPRAQVSSSPKIAQTLGQALTHRRNYCLWGFFGIARLWQQTQQQ